MDASSSDRGFSLVEVVFAIGLLSGAVTTLAQLIAISAHTTALARYHTTASVLAQQKLEELRSEVTLDDTASAVEHMDRSGQRVCGTQAACEPAVYTVRWSVSPFTVVPATVLIQVGVVNAYRNYGEVRSFAIRARSVG